MVFVMPESNGAEWAGTASDRWPTSGVPLEADPAHRFRSFVRRGSAVDPSDSVLALGGQRRAQRLAVTQG